jgi:hypothetical protein
MSLVSNLWKRYKAVVVISPRGGYTCMPPLIYTATLTLPMQQHIKPTRNKQVLNL